MAEGVGLIAPLVGVAGALIGVGLGHFFNDRREAKRLEHEQKMKIREERLQAYATMARITKTIDPLQSPTQADLGQALSEIELLSENDKLQQCARTLAEIGCVPPFTHSVVSRAVQLMMPTVS